MFLSCFIAGYITVIENALDRREGIFLQLYDFSAAFDAIDRELMQKRLFNIGAEETALKWFSSY